jgi:FhaA, N-terminal domain/FHA domain
VGVLDNFEKKLDRMVNGAFAKAFRSEVQPVEIAAGLQRELDDRATVVSRVRTVVPNVFVVELAPSDHERLSAYEQTVADELGTLVREYAQQQRYSFLGPAEVSLALDESLGTGVFRIRSEVRAGPQPAAPAAVDVSGQPHLEVDGAVYPLFAVTRLGRGTDVDIRIDDPGVSRHHAEITLGTDVTIRDLGSTNGTLVNGRMVGTQILVDGARVQLGSTTLTYRAR